MLLDTLKEDEGVDEVECDCGRGHKVYALATGAGSPRYTLVPRAGSPRYTSVIGLAALGTHL